MLKVYRWNIVFLSGIPMTDTCSLKDARLSTNRYQNPDVTSNWRPILHDLRCATFDVLYSYYKQLFRIPVLEQHLEDYEHMSCSGKGHVPVIECLFFLYHWKETQNSLWTISRNLQWNRVYNKEKKLAEQLAQQNDLEVYFRPMLPTFVPTYWSTDMRMLPLREELRNVVFYGLHVANAFNRLQEFRGFFLEHIANQLELEPACLWEDESYRLYYPSLWLLESVYMIYVKSIALSAQEVSDSLALYGWSLVVKRKDMLRPVVPEWLTSTRLTKSEHLTGMCVKPGMLDQFISWPKIVNGDLVELAVLCTFLKDQPVTNLINPATLSVTRRALAVKSQSDLLSYVDEMQGRGTKYKMRWDSVHFELFLFHSNRYLSLPTNYVFIRDPILLKPP